MGDPKSQIVSHRKAVNSTKTCTKCGDEFHPYGNQKRCHCCRQLICSQCGKIFISGNSLIAQKFCSQICKALSQVGKQRTEETKRKIGLASVGNKYSLGKRATEETKKKLSEARKGKKRPPFTKEWVANMKKYWDDHPEMRRKFSEMKRGEKSSSWKGGVTLENKLFRCRTEMKLWRKSIFERDNFTCQRCGKEGGELRAHHIFNFADYPDRRIDINNGITLDLLCHDQFHKLYGKKNNTENQLKEFLL